MLASLDRTFSWLRAKPFFYRFTLFTRILLAAAFIPTGMVKLQGRRFTLIPPSDPIGAFFEALYQTGDYWRFLGATQILAGLLLLWPRTAHLGAAIFLPIALNILVITVSLGFRGTPFVAALMLLASLYLCFWDYHRFRGLFTTDSPASPPSAHRLDRWETLGFTAFAICLLAFFALTRDYLSSNLSLPLISLGISGGLLALGRFAWMTCSAQRAAKKQPPR